MREQNYRLHKIGKATEGEQKVENVTRESEGTSRKSWRKGMYCYNISFR